MRFATVILLAALAMPTPSNAFQSVSDLRVRRGVSTSVAGAEQDVALPNDEGRKVFGTFVECAMRAGTRRIDAFLATFPGSPLERTLTVELATSDCLRDGRIRLDGAAMRGEIYAQLYRRRYGDSGPAGFATVGPIDYTSGRDATRARDVAGSIAIRRFFDCSVRADPVGARAFVLTAAAAPEEGPALRAMLPSLQGCLAEGQALDVNIGRAKNLVAEVLYRLSDASSGR